MKNRVSQMVRNTAQNEQGQSMLEFMLVLPCMILILILAIEFGWICINNIRLTEAAGSAAFANRETVRSKAKVQTEVYLKEYYSGFKPSRMKVTAVTRQDTYYYDEIMWKWAQRKYWQIPMKFETLKTDIYLEYELPCLTSLGAKLIGGSRHLEAVSTAYYVMDHGIVE